MARTPTQNTEIGAQTGPIQLAPDGSLTIRDAAAVLGVSAQTIRNWIEGGCPHIAGGQGRGNVARIKVRELMDWRVADLQARLGDGADGGYDEARAKAADWHYRAIKRQADARKELGALIAVDDVAAAVAEDYERVRSRLNSVPSRVSVQAAAETDASVVRAMIARAIADALQNLSDPDQVILAAGGDPDASVHDVLDLDLAALGALPEDDEGADDADAD
jgi:phage terminase Nu1 subunit (DNA packaging protein)